MGGGTISRTVGGIDSLRSKVDMCELWTGVIIEISDSSPGG